MRIHLGSSGKSGNGANCLGAEGTARGFPAAWEEAGVLRWEQLPWRRAGSKLAVTLPK